MSTMPTLRRNRMADTSLDAFAYIKPLRKTDQAYLLNLLRLRGPMTRPELATASGISLQTVCGRVNDLLRAKLVEKTGERREGCNEMRATSSQAVLL